MSFIYHSIVKDYSCMKDNYQNNQEKWKHQLKSAHVTTGRDNKPYSTFFSFNASGFLAVAFNKFVLRTEDRTMCLL